MIYEIKNERSSQLRYRKETKKYHLPVQGDESYCGRELISKDNKLKAICLEV